MESLEKEKILLPANRRLSIWLQISFWIFFLLIHVVVVGIAVPLDVAVMRGFANVLPLLALFYINTRMVDRFFERGQIILYLFFAFVLILGIGWLRVQINLNFPNIGQHLLALGKKEMLQVGAILTNGAILLLSTFYRLIENRNQRERRFQAIREKQQTAQLQFLRSQINPHFLFNTLNNIYSLAVAGSKQTAPMVLQLSKLLRYVLYDSQREKVEMQREAEQLDKFIALFQMRSEEPLDIVFTRKGDLSGVEIEPMILIPLLENCFKHCDFDNNPDAFVRIKLEVLPADRWSFITENTFNPDDKQKDKTGGVGLVNIRQRLQLKYPRQFELSTQKEGDLFLVKLHYNPSTP
ncbi:MAG: hypothetical protein GYB31_14820 [Bacteroidetes bacterium]|nr:hypothetical protein [Bacteroidota bacterium]